MRSNKAAWQKFRRGDLLTNQELDSLIEASEWGCGFLEARGETGGVLFALRFDLESLRGSKLARNADSSGLPMRTYPITDHVPESELAAITREGAERWLERHGWTRESSLWCSPPPDDITVPWPKDIDRIVNVIGVAVMVHRMGPRAIIEEMQADTRIIEAGRKVAGQ